MNHHSRAAGLRSLDQLAAQPSGFSLSPYWHNHGQLSAGPTGGSLDSIELNLHLGDICWLSYSSSDTQHPGLTWMPTQRAASTVVSPSIGHENHTSRNALSRRARSDILSRCSCCDVNSSLSTQHHNALPRNGRICSATRGALDNYRQDRPNAIG